MDLPQPNDDAIAAAPRILSPDPRLTERWQHAIAAVNKGRHVPLILPSPLDVVPEMMRVRGLPAMPWPIEWPELGRRCRTYPGDVLVVVGGTGSGKSQWGVQLARGFVGAARGCVLWTPLELTPTDINLRIVANLTGTHAMTVRDQWTEGAITNALCSVTDRWRYVDVRDGASAIQQIEIMELAVDQATKIYGAPPLLVIDYVQLMIGGEDPRGAIAEVMLAVARMTARRGCYTLALSQTSRANSPSLAGRVEVESAADQVGAGAESAAIERAAANSIALNVFKLDDASVLDAHCLVSKARHTGLEGKVGAKYSKAGGVWSELDHLPATHAEAQIEAVKRSKRGAPEAVADVRISIGQERAEAATNARREAVIAALRAAGPSGVGLTALRLGKGTGSAQRVTEMLAELQGSGRARYADGRWILVQ